MDYKEEDDQEDDDVEMKEEDSDDSNDFEQQIKLLSDKLQEVSDVTLCFQKT